MNISERLIYLQSEMDKTISSFKSDRQHDRMMAFRLKISSILFASIITILLGLKVDSFWSELFKNIALILGSVITVINAVDAFYNHRSLWIRRTVTLVRLYDLKRNLSFYISGLEQGEINSERIDEYLFSFHQILNDDLNAWLKLREESPPVRSTNNP